MPASAPYGTWTSPLPAARVAAGELRLSAVAIDGDDIYWVEGRPQEGGRNVLVRRDAGGRIADVTPPGTNVRTRVHEYGGTCYAVAKGAVYYANFSDGRIYAGSAKQDPAYVPITPEGKWFYADFEIDRRRNRLMCVREDHTQPGEPVNTLVSIQITGDPWVAPTTPCVAPTVIAAGYDFYSTPRLSPDGSMLAWLSWRHPNMPWDGTELWVADVTASGALEHASCVAGGADVSIYQPGWTAEGTLCFAADDTGWWTLMRAQRRDGSWRATPLTQLSGAEFGRPEWVLGTATWLAAGPSRLVVSYTQRGLWHLATVDERSGAVFDVAPGLQPHEWLAATDTDVVLVAGSATQPNAVVRVDLGSGAVETIREASSVKLDAADVSEAQPIECPTTGGLTAHAFYYPPCNHAFTAPPGGRPPLIVITHGGPTAAAKATFNLEVQFWTTRGFAVVDVNYGGSSGFGRAYRQRLAGTWGIVDVDDVINAAGYLVQEGLADPHRLIVRGGSAGGYTTLAALTFRPGVFKAGASYYGISDLEVLELDTHKFESRYSHSLIGPYPERKDIYYERSPIHFVDRLAAPLILFQGLEDKVVPPNQSQMMADALRAKGLPVAYLAFEGEQHGFRKAETITRSLEAELYFYGAVLGFEPADQIEPVPIANLRSNS
ncbi:MAG: S9 family peptidase [Acidimicrobiia bacterium]|nr:S9 family peptidase [Acidimicrobiia bacterium]